MSTAMRAAIWVLPASCLGLAALVILGPGAERRVIGMRVWGAPVDGSEVLALRLEAVRRLQGVDDPAPLSGVEVNAASAGRPLERWTGSTGADGIGEALLRAPGGLREPLVLRITRAGEVLAEERAPLLPAPQAAERRPIPGVGRGGIGLRVTADRGSLAAPFPETLRVAVTSGDGTPLSGARVEASAVGADLDGHGGGPVQRVADALGHVALEVTPRAHTVELTLHAARPAGTDSVRAHDAPSARTQDAPSGRAHDASSGRTQDAPSGRAHDAEVGTWEGTLPVVPGAIWLDPTGLAGERPELRLVSPSPRPQAYVSLEGAHGRLLGAIVPLAADGAGFFSGALALPDDPALRDARHAVIASDPYEQGAGTVVWPLSSAATPIVPRRVRLLADGLPAAEARERARARQARRAGLLVLGAAATAEVLLLLVTARSARRRLEAHLADASGDEDEAGRGPGTPLSREDRGRLLAAARAEPLLGLLAFAALIGLSFTVVAALATFR